MWLPSGFELNRSTECARWKPNRSNFAYRYFSTWPWSTALLYYDPDNKRDGEMVFELKSSYYHLTPDDLWWLTWETYRAKTRLFLTSNTQHLTYRTIKREGRTVKAKLVLVSPLYLIASGPTALSIFRSTKVARVGNKMFSFDSGFEPVSSGW